MATRRRPRRPPNDIQIIRRTLRRAGDPQWKYAKDLAAASRLSGRPWQLIAAIAQAESSGGRATPSNAPYNFWGWSVNTGQSYSDVTGPFSNPHTAYRYYGKQLKKKYSGGNSINDPVWEKYAASPAWQGNVSAFLRKYGSGPNQIGSANAGFGPRNGVANTGRPNTGRGGGTAGGVSPEMKKLRSFAMQALAGGMSATELLPFVMAMKSQMPAGGGGGGRGGRGGQPQGAGEPATPRGRGYAPRKYVGLPIRAPMRWIGTPYSGTHTVGNWQSDNAVDIAAPVGTPIYATQDGVIGDRIGSLGSSNPRMAGLRLTLMGRSNQFYYAHLSKLLVKAGQRVKKGQLIGYSGSANGTAHLHIGVLHGDPRKIFGR